MLCLCVIMCNVSDILFFGDLQENTFLGNGEIPFFMENAFLGCKKQTNKQKKSLY